MQRPEPRSPERELTLFLRWHSRSGERDSGALVAINFKLGCAYGVASFWLCSWATFI